jgi:hypothetical protein
VRLSRDRATLTVTFVTRPARTNVTPSAVMSGASTPRLAGVPVVAGRGGVLDLDALQPGTLARRLVEVPVDCDESGTAHE